MNKLLAIALVMVSLGAFAMPTPAELSKAQPLVTELMKPCVAQLRKGAMTPEAVGDKAVEFAAAAETPAAKYLFLKGAVPYYVRAREYDKAADAIESIMSEIENVPQETLLKLATSATERVNAKAAPRLWAIRRRAAAQVKCAAALKTLLPQVRKNKNDRRLVRRYAELTAATGGWEKALKAFAAVGGTLGETAQSELDGTATSAAIADFWWNYKPLEADAADAIRARAAFHYRAALDNGELEGLALTLAEQRVAQISAEPAPAVAPSQPASGGRNDYMIVDLASGKVSFEGMSSQDAANKKYNTDVYKTKKMVFRKIKAGTYTIGHTMSGINPQHVCTLPQDFWMAIFPCTRDQYARLTGGTPDGDTRPQTAISWNTIRGSAPIAATPTMGVLANLNARTKAAGFPVGAGFDLPTVSMFEIAGRAGMTTKFPWGDDLSAHSLYGCWKEYSGDTGGIEKLPKVGQKNPNDWGLYDVIGLLHEWFRDMSPVKGVTCASFTAQNANALCPNATGLDSHRLISSENSFIHKFRNVGFSDYYGWRADREMMRHFGFRFAWHK